MKIYTLFFTLLFTSSLLAQQMSFSVNENYVSQFGSNSDLVSFIPLFKLESTIHNKEKSLPYHQLPKSLDTAHTAYGFINFSGVPGSRFKDELTLLVENYSTPSPTIYVDRNGNLDFSDDGSSFSLEENYRIKLINQNHSIASYNYNLSRSKVNKENEMGLTNRYSNKYPNSRIIPASNWLTLERLSIRIHTDSINNKPFTLILSDKSADGLFTFEPNETGDRILIVEGKLDPTKDLTSLLRRAEPIDHNAVFELYGINYFVEDVSITGNKVSLSKTTKNTRVYYDKGMDISSFSIDLIDGTSLTIKDLIKGQKYLLIDVGGTWCGGCIAQEPNIKEIYKTAKVEVLGLFDHDTHQSVKTYIQNHQIEWPVALVSPSFRQLFRLDFFPTYILVSSEGKILMADRSSEQIMKFINSKNE